MLKPLPQSEQPLQGAHETLQAKAVADEAPLSVEAIVEAPINIVYGGMPYAVMMATPADLEDFVAGFSLTEGVIETLAQMRDLRFEETQDGWLAHVAISPEAMQRVLRRKRTLAGRSSCGLCGVESLGDLPRAKPSALRTKVSPEAVVAARDALRAYQPLHEMTRAAHGAFWCSIDGEIVLAREDVGRHNALDKLIGAAARAGQEAARGFVLVTSRCSYEMVEKAAAFGAPLLVALSAPTTLAVARARELGIGLIANARGQQSVFVAPEV
ncbi:MAG: formate dehydrogenase accessory sulfurtransferase FdhD [Hyphomicrobiales bacterium]|nr:formate dehydrogenase accessory sulfurtransferase FdhD [Hyphomicrobiales bacterium]